MSVLYNLSAVSAVVALSATPLRGCVVPSGAMPGLHPGACGHWFYTGSDLNVPLIKMMVLFYKLFKPLVECSFGDDGSLFNKPKFIEIFIFSVCL